LAAPVGVGGLLFLLFGGITSTGVSIVLLSGSALGTPDDDITIDIEGPKLGMSEGPKLGMSDNIPNGAEDGTIEGKSEICAFTVTLHSEHPWMESIIKTNVDCLKIISSTMLLYL
jgi:hypothetical protein